MTTTIPQEPLTDRDSPIAFTADVSDAPPPRRDVPTWRLVLRRPLGLISLSFLLLLVGAATFASSIAPFDPNALDLLRTLAGPGSDHLLGTDPLGRDVLSRLIYGGRLSLIDAAIASAAFLLVGVSSGLVAGYFGGWADRVFSWVIDVVIALPALIILLVVIAVFGSNMVIIMAALGVLSAPGFARVVRGITLEVRQELYISAARVSGLPNRKILLRHVLPRLTGPILVQFSLFFGGALIIDAGLSYLGFGPQPPTPTWGGMIVEAASVISQQPWLVVPPGLTLTLATLAFTVLGDTIREVTAERAGRALPQQRTRQRKLTSKSRDASAAPERPAPAMLAIRDVSISLPIQGASTTVVESLSLDLQAGETVGLVGESGCGKSIAASAILGLLPPGGQVTAGSIRFDGVELAASSRSAYRRIRGREIALISQEPLSSLDPSFTVAQQVGELVKRHHGGSSKSVRTRTLDLLADVRLPDPDRVARRYPHELSGGMAQRVAIAMALAGEPRLLIADEPTTALDVTIQAEILALLDRLQAERDMAILLITHDWGVVAASCQRVYVMYAGHVVESADVAGTLNRPLHPYTLGLLSSTPRNARPHHRLPAIPGTVPAPGTWPDGCHFAPRCGLATADCTAGPVPLLEPLPGHRTRCLHHSEVPSGGEND